MELMFCHSPFWGRKKNICHNYAFCFLHEFIHQCRDFMVWKVLGQCCNNCMLATLLPSGESTCKPWHQRVPQNCVPCFRGKLCFHALESQSSECWTISWRAVNNVIHNHCLRSDCMLTYFTTQQPTHHVDLGVCHTLIPTLLCYIWSASPFCIFEEWLKLECPGWNFKLRKIKVHWRSPHLKVTVNVPGAVFARTSIVSDLTDGVHKIQGDESYSADTRQGSRGSCKDVSFVITLLKAAFHLFLEPRPNVTEEQMTSYCTVAFLVSRSVNLLAGCKPQ